MKKLLILFATGIIAGCSTSHVNVTQIPAPVIEAAVQAAVQRAVPETNSVRLSWDASQSPEVTGYKVYWGVGSRNYTNANQAGNNLSNTVTGVTPGVKYFFAATAYDAFGAESDFSNEVTNTLPVPPVLTNYNATPMVFALSIVTNISDCASLKWSYATSNLTYLTISNSVTVTNTVAGFRVFYGGTSNLLSSNYFFGISSLSPIGVVYTNDICGLNPNPTQDYWFSMSVYNAAGTVGSTSAPVKWVRYAPTNEWIQVVYQSGKGASLTNAYTVNYTNMNTAGQVFWRAYETNRPIGTSVWTHVGYQRGIALSGIGSVSWADLASANYTNNTAQRGKTYFMRINRTWY